MTLTREDVADALSVIREEGAACQWIGATTVLHDPLKPWLGGVTTPNETPVHIAFVDQATAAALVTAWAKDGEVGSSTLFGLMGNHGFEPRIGQQVQRPNSSERLVVKDVTTAAPADVAVFYLLEFNA